MTEPVHIEEYDYLRQNPEAARVCANLKRILAEKFRDNRHEYMMAKTDFIERIMEFALAGHSATADAIERRC